MAGGEARAGVIQVRVDDLSEEATRALIETHLAGMHAASPPGTVYALDVSALVAPEITVWSAWIGVEIAGVAALKRVSAEIGELKSMRTATRFLRQGVSKALLEHIVGAARAEGMRRLCLETGSGPTFEPALALYRRAGFQDGEAFGDYAPSAFNQFLHLDL